MDDDTNDDSDAWDAFEAASDRADQHGPDVLGDDLDAPAMAELVRDWFDSEEGQRVRERIADAGPIQPVDLDADRRREADGGTVPRTPEDAKRRADAIRKVGALLPGVRSVGTASDNSRMWIELDPPDQPADETARTAAALETLTAALGFSTALVTETPAPTYELTLGDDDVLDADRMRGLYREETAYRAGLDRAAADRVAATLRDMGVVIDASTDGRIVDAWISDRGVNLGNLHGPDADDRAVVNICEVGPAEMYNGAPDGAAVYVNALVSHRDD